MPSLIVYLIPPMRSVRSGLVVQPERAGAVEDLEVLERVLLDHDQVGEESGADDAELDRRALGLVQRLGAVQGRGPHDLERVEAGLLQQLELLDVAEAVELVDEPGVRSRGDSAARVLEVVEELIHTR